MQPTLESKRVKLTPLKLSNCDILWPIAKDIDVFEYGPSDISTREKLKSYIQDALDQESAKRSIPFIIYDKTTNDPIGCTRFGLIDTKNLVLHIGWTWISEKVRGTGFNHEMKYLMLAYAFETLLFKKVEFRIDERNIASRKAVEKLGASLEGILRKNVIVKNGFTRSSCCYGILFDEWPSLKKSAFKDVEVNNLGESPRRIVGK